MEKLSQRTRRESRERNKEGGERRKAKADYNINSDEQMLWGII